VLHLLVREYSSKLEVLQPNFTAEEIHAVVPKVKKSALMLKCGEMTSPEVHRGAADVQQYYKLYFTFYLTLTN